MPSIQELRDKDPDLKDLDDDQVLDVVHQAYYPDLPRETVAKALGYTPPPPPPPKRTLLGTAGDVGLSLAKGAVEVPEAVVGLADIPSGGLAGKALESAGFRPKDAKEYLDSLKSPAQHAADKDVSSADGLWNTIKAAVRNPSVAIHSAIESVPTMGLGGVFGRALATVAPRVAAAFGSARQPVMAGAFGEGVVGAGQAAEQYRQDTPGGRLDATQAGLAVASGAADTAFALIGGKVAKTLGIHDPDTMVATGKLMDAAALNPKTEKFVARRIAEGFVSEGLLEELPQSVAEQLAQNLAEGKDLMDGMSNAAVLGAFSGGLMGAGANLRGQHHDTPAPVPPVQPGPAPGAASPPPTSPITPVAAVTPAAAAHPTPNDVLHSPDLDTAIQTALQGVGAAPVVPTINADDDPFASSLLHKPQGANLAQPAVPQAVTSSSPGAAPAGTMLQPAGVVSPDGAQPVAGAAPAGVLPDAAGVAPGATADAAAQGSTGRPDVVGRDGATGGDGDVQAGQAITPGGGPDVRDSGGMGASQPGQGNTGGNGAGANERGGAAANPLERAPAEAGDGGGAAKPLDEGNGRRVTPHQLALQLARATAAVGQFEGQNKAKPSDAGRMAEADARDVENVVRTKIAAERRNSPDVWKAYDDEQRVVANLEPGAKVDTPDGPGIVLKKFARNWQVQIDGVGRRLLPPGALKPLENSNAPADRASTSADAGGRPENRPADEKPAGANPAPSPSAAPASVPGAAATEPSVVPGAAPASAPKADDVQAAVAGPRKVTIADQEVELTHEQATEWDRVTREAQTDRQRVLQQYLHDKAAGNPDNPDVGYRGATEQRDVALKAIGMKLSAERRRIAGVQTPKEVAAAAKEEQTLHTGTPVVVNGENGTVTGTAFGKYKVTFHDGSKTIVPRDQIAKRDVSHETAQQSKPAGEDQSAAPGKEAPTSEQPRDEKTGQFTAEPVQRRGGIEPGKPAPVYAQRMVKNADAIIAWARGEGFKDVEAADKLHVTIAFSRDKVDVGLVGNPSPKYIDGTVTGGNRSVEKLGDQGAIVLKFASPVLNSRWAQFDRAGASWDFEGYTPHVTISYGDNGMDLSKVSAYAGPIEFGPEIQEPLGTEEKDDESGRPNDATGVEAAGVGDEGKAPRADGSTAVGETAGAASEPAVRSGEAEKAPVSAAAESAPVQSQDVPTLNKRMLTLRSLRTCLGA